jgi:hypothetical protein
MNKIVHIIKPEHKRVFYSFLKANNALEQFKRNCRYRGRKERWLNSSYNYDLEDVIDYAFFWSDQPEGSSFWRVLHYKWQKYVQERLNI